MAYVRVRHIFLLCGRILVCFHIMNGRKDVMCVDEFMCLRLPVAAKSYIGKDKDFY